MILFPFFSAIFSGIFLVLMLFPTIILALWEGTSEVGNWEVMEYVILFVTYLGTAIIATFFNVCMVYSAKTRFEGGNPTFFGSLGYAFSKIHLIFLWGVLSATVGVLLSILKNAAQNAKSPVGRVAGSVAHAGASVAWSVTTIFVVPAMVYYNMTPFKAIKKSVQTLKKTWGESIVKVFGMGIIKFLIYLLIVVIIGGVLYLVWGSGWQTILLVIGIGLLLLIITALVFSAAAQVFDTALFVYADKGQVPQGWNKQLLSTSVKN